MDALQIGKDEAIFFLDGSKSSKAIVDEIKELVSSILRYQLKRSFLCKCLTFIITAIGSQMCLSMRLLASHVVPTHHN